jgi:hypothetical protein
VTFDSLGWTAAHAGAASEPLLVVAISTEEEFDWLAQDRFVRRSTTVRAARNLERAQVLFDRLGVRPIYLVDHPVATQHESIAPLREFLRSGHCEIGAHLHPWVSPPHEEEPSPANSFPCNLPGDLEGRKLRILVEAIESAFEVRPRAYQAGRYGFGPASVEGLLGEGFETDFSISPPFDFRCDGGPDWSGVGCQPFWLGSGRRLLVVPVTGAYVGFAGRSSHALHEWARSMPEWSRVPGMLARLGAVERLRLSPEGFRSKDLRRLTRSLLRQGQRVFVLSFHSPSLLPGCTPYVRNERDLEALLERCRAYIEFFLGELGGRSVTSAELRRCLADRGASA